MLKKLHQGNNLRFCAGQYRPKISRNGFEQRVRPQPFRDAGGETGWITHHYGVITGENNRLRRKAASTTGTMGRKRDNSDVRPCNGTDFIR
ncbi:hypothetical protein [Erwinia amylovora]|uniref:hypothetical protein n=1 Tax=Erwinia amylovora TaxID=552 RepID=UPI00144412E5|nr:hypothetical protein [Erwinia amylovora]